MKTYIFETTKGFDKTFLKYMRRLDRKQKFIFSRKISIFYSNPFDVSLKTHKLSGDMEGFLSSSVSSKDRIIFSIEKELVTL